MSNLLVLLKEPTSRPEQFRVSLERISYVAKKISTTSRFATRANHRAAQESLTGDLIEYIREYLLNIYGGKIFNLAGLPIPIRFNQDAGVSFSTVFTPINVSMIFDNLLSNSRKHKAKNINVTVIDSSSQLTLSFCDDGVGIPKRNFEHLFEIGFTTTEGSGLGLYHVKEIMTEMGGSITLNTKHTGGAEFLLIFPKS